MMATTLDQIRAHIAQDELDNAVQLLQTMLADSPRLHEALSHAGRLAYLENQLHRGVLSHEQADTARNRIRAGLIDFLGEIDKAATYNPVVKQELTDREQRIYQRNQQGDNISGGVHAGGDYVRGDKVAGDKVTHVDNRQYNQQLTFNASMVMDAVLYFFSDCVALLSKPAAFVRAAWTEKRPGSPPLPAALLFYLIASVVVGLLAILTPQVVDLTGPQGFARPAELLSATVFLKWLVASVTMGGVVFGVWRVLGKQVAWATAILISCYLVGASNILMGIGNLAAGKIAMVDPRVKLSNDSLMVLSNNLQSLIGADFATQPTPQQTKKLEKLILEGQGLYINYQGIQSSGLFRIARVVMLLFTLLGLVVMWSGWKSWTSVVKATWGQLILSFILTIVGLALVDGLLDFVFTPGGFWESTNLS